MTLNSVIKYIDKNRILASRDGVGTMKQSKSWSDFVVRFGTLNMHDMGSIGEIIIDKLAGASDEVVEKFKLEIHDLKISANATHKRHIETIRDLQIKGSKQEERIDKKNKQLANLRYRLNKSDVRALRDVNKIMSIGNYKLIKENK
jgi:hypothetical protein